MTRPRGTPDAGTRRRRVRLVTVAASCLTLLVTGAGPALADPAGPTHYRATVTGLEPDVAVVDARVEGGDAFLVLTVAPGHSAAVPGADGEPYLRFDPDGAVYVNDRSPTRWLNDARYGLLAVAVPPQADPDAPPQWRQVAITGTYAWHDHNIHWMSPAVPDQVDVAAGQPQPVFTWQRPIAVDGRPVAITGELVWLPGPGPALAVGVAVVALVVGLALALRAGATAVVAGVAAAAAVAAAITGASTLVGLAPGVEADPLRLVLPAVALAVAAAGAARARRSDVQAALLVTLAAVPLLVWAGTSLSALTAPILPHALPDAAVRTVVAAVLGLGLAVVIAGLRQLLARPDFDALTA